jgi:putative tryptophan/tyrosine transport system substrate-binding protein
MTLLGSAAAWPLAARVQQPALPVIGVLSASGQKRVASQVSGFLNGLNELGFTEGRSVAIEIRATDVYDHLPGLAAELVGHRVALMCAAGAANSAQAAKVATTTIPIVFVNGSDPVMSGLVMSMNHPGGNVTGIARQRHRHRHHPSSGYGAGAFYRSPLGPPHLPRILGPFRQ